MFEKLKNYFYGYVLFKATGGFPERFFNLCKNNDVFIWDIKEADGVIYAKVHIENYKKLRIFAKRAGMKISVQKKAGLPFVLFHNRRRFALPISILIFSFIIIFLSNFIWTVDVVGNERIPAEDIIEAFEELGVKPGTQKRRLDITDITNKALLKLDNIEWSTININGSNATIKVKEKIPVPQIKNSGNPQTNIVADVSGTVKRIDLYKGTSCVKVGEEVEKGNVLVTGAHTNKDTSITFGEASAYITAQTKQNLIYINDTSKNMRVYTKHKKRFFISFFSIKFPINFLFLQKDENYDYFKSSSFIEINNKKLPVGIITESFDIYQNEKLTLDNKISTLISLQKMMQNRERFLSDKQLISEKNTVGKNSIVCNITCLESIGKEEKMDIEFSSVENDE